MTNKEFVVELVSLLNEINTDNVKQIGHTCNINQVFVISELVNVVPLMDMVRSAKYDHSVGVSLAVNYIEDYRKVHRVLLRHNYVRPSNEEIVSQETIDKVYDQLKKEILKNILFCKEGSYTNAIGDKVGILPVGTIIKEGFKNAETRLLSV